MASSILNVYNRFDIVVDRAEGAYVFDTEGNKYLDFISGIAVNNLGHCHPKIVNALKLQSEKLWSISNLFYTNEGESYALELVKNSFADKVFFCNSGTEAIEATIKLARKYHYEKGNPEKNRIITFSKAFHGRTIASLSASHYSKNLKEGFSPLLEGFDYVEFNSIKSVKEAVSSKTAAILIEPIQGEGGINVANEQFLKDLREIADKNDILLCFDEVQSGFGRTGKLFAYEHYNVEPDIMACAKGIGGGFPLGACFVSEKLVPYIHPGVHGSTYGGNSLAMAVGKVVLEEISSKDFLEKVCNMSDIIFSKLEILKNSYPNVISEVRGKGLFIGINLLVDIDIKEYISKLIDNNFLVVSASNNVVRLLPPLIIDEKHIEEAFVALEKVCKSFK